jgi:hypothetical protein
MDSKIDVFNFSKDSIINHIIYDLKLLKKIGKSFEYVFEKLQTKKYHLEIKNQTEFRLEKLKWSEDKNYKWICITKDNVKLLIRSYGTHHTIFTKLVETHKFDDNTSYDEKIYSAFTFFSNLENVGDELHDSYIDNPYTDLNGLLLDIISFVKEDQVHGMWNDYSFKRPKWCEVENVYNGGTITSVDKLIWIS